MKKHIVCFGDSNTHGYCADPADCADGGDRFNEDERWTCLLQKRLGEEYLVLEEGLSGRTTVFTDPLHESMAGVEVAYPILMSHEVVDLLIIMLGTNDTKERFAANAPAIAVGMERLLLKCQSVPCWGGKKPNILVVCPPPLGAGFHDEVMRGEIPRAAAVSGGGRPALRRGVLQRGRMRVQPRGLHPPDAPRPRAARREARGAGAGAAVR